jgi:hypothetical protein
VKIFISSTYEDLKSHRAVLEASLLKSAYQFDGMEHFTADSQPPIEVCLDAVRRSDVFIGILGMRYGSCPRGNRLSYTEREYRLAYTLKKPIFMFLIDEQKATIVPRDIENDRNKAEKLQVLKERVLKRHNVARFTTDDNLAWQVLASLRIAELRAKEEGFV